MSSDTPRRPGEEQDEPQQDAVEHEADAVDGADGAAGAAGDDVTTDEHLAAETPEVTSPATDVHRDVDEAGAGADEEGPAGTPEDDGEVELDARPATDDPATEIPEAAHATSAESPEGDPGDEGERGDGAGPDADEVVAEADETDETDQTAEDADRAEEPATGAAASRDADGPPRSGWRRLGHALRPRAARSQILAGVLCAALGFALVVQVQQSASDQLSSARQEDLVRLLDEVTNRAEQLATEVSGLEDTRDDLVSGSGQAQSALELAQERAESEGILSGRLPAEGPGVTITITDSGGVLEAAQLFNVLEELRNAGAEVVELNGVRLVTSTWFRDEGGAIVVDDEPLESPYEWTVIGDPQTMDRALEIPGGALATVRTAGAEASTTAHDRVEITAVREPDEPEFATPQEPAE